ncbi:hypothetical protein [Spiroplasma endosymbiont of Dioctria linearis]|uniref:hypothetical protein n=1 Tax=Spiroplasma endosymbiont of Dioctria linearis TaxID=3066290 RepID=UPI00313C19E3
MNEFDKDISDCLQQINTNITNESTDTEISKIKDEIFSLLISKKFKKTSKKKLIENILNNDEDSIQNLKKIINKKLEWKRNEKIKEFEKKEIFNIIKSTLFSNKDKRQKTKDIKNKIEQLDNEIYKDYGTVITRTLVYEVIQKLRKELRQENFKKGYIISKNAIKEKSDKEGKVDGWEFTQNTEKIKMYLEIELKEIRKKEESFSKYLEILEKNI